MIILILHLNPDQLQIFLGYRASVYLLYLGIIHKHVVILSLTSTVNNNNR
jgi:hypothetical protein